MSVRLEALPELESAWDATVSDAAAEGIQLTIADFGGFRTANDTALILSYKQADYDAYAAAARAAGRTPVPITGPWDDGSPRPIAPYGQSWHDYGAARDADIVSFPSSMTLEDAIVRVDAIATANGLDTGAAYSDPLHLQLPVSLDEARARWAEYSSSSSSSLVWVLLAIGVGAAATVRLARRWGL
jgi:hypothetical protein